MTDYFNIPDKRSNNPEDYERRDRRGQMKRSWAIGMGKRQDGHESIRFNEGLTWGSIGQILGYLLGETDDAFKNELFQRMLDNYRLTDRGAPLRGVGPAVALRMVTWNLRYSAEAHTRRRLHFLKQLDCDIVALQEVSRKAWRVFQEDETFTDGVYAINLMDQIPSGIRPHGAAVLVRNGLTLHNPQLIPGLPRLERAISVCVEGAIKPLEVVSWHAPNAAQSAVETKMSGYRGILDWIAGRDNATLLGFDGNHWNQSVSLDPKPATDEGNPFFLQHVFYASNAPHVLQDALLAYYKQDNVAYQQALKQRPDGPLAISYVRGSKRNPVPDRFDYIFATPDIEIMRCVYDFEGAIAAGSDHGIVIADILLESNST